MAGQSPWPSNSSTERPQAARPLKGNQQFPQHWDQLPALQLGAMPSDSRTDLDSFADALRSARQDPEGETRRAFTRPPPEDLSRPGTAEPMARGDFGGYVRRALVPSDFNLGSFLEWVFKASPAEVEGVRHLYSVAHRADEPTEPIRLLRQGELLHAIPVWACMDVGCSRCLTRGGGYKFDWVGPWTCIAGEGAPGEDPGAARVRWFQCRDPQCTIRAHADRADDYLVFGAAPPPVL